MELTYHNGTDTYPYRLVLASVNFRAFLGLKAPDNAQRRLSVKAEDLVMLPPRYLIILLACVGAMAGAATELDADDVVIEQMMERMDREVGSADISYTIEHMYQPIRDSMGGKAALAEAAKKLPAIMASLRMTMISYVRVKPYSYVTTESRKYVLIPTETVFDLAGRRLTLNGYDLGIKTPDGQWQFINGDKLTPQAYQRFFPDFPKDTDIPPVTQRLD